MKTVWERIEAALREPDFEEMYQAWLVLQLATGGPNAAIPTSNCKRAMIFGWKQAKGGE